MRSNFNTMSNALNQYRLSLAVFATGALLLAGCRDKGTPERPTPEAEPAVSASTQVHSSVTERTSPSVKPTLPGSAAMIPFIRFNDLWAGDPNKRPSPVVNTYNGPGESAFDRTPTNKTYWGGGPSVSEMPVECQTTGRIVTSRHDLGEQRRSSGTWFRLAGTAAPEYASATYADLIANVPVPPCK